MKINFKEITPNPFHPTIPDKYKDETDYRKIPNEYLEKNIPQGRGMIKWAPFATTPKLYEEVDDMKKSQDYIKKPELTEEQIYLNSLHITHQMTTKGKCTIKYYENYDILFISGFVIKIDTNTSSISVQLDNQPIIKVLKFDNIIEILK